jgi:hypothetical protein
VAIGRPVRGGGGGGSGGSSGGSSSELLENEGPFLVFSLPPESREGRVGG